MAARSRFTPETRGALLERFAAGVVLADAAKAVEISEKTIKTWLTRGRKEESGPYADFAHAVDQARDAAKRRPQPMDGDELARVVSVAARRGSVTAMKLRWEMLRADEEPAAEEEPADPLDELDELARRRAVRA